MTCFCGCFVHDEQLFFQIISMTQIITTLVASLLPINESRNHPNFYTPHISKYMNCKHHETKKLFRDAVKDNEPDRPAFRTFFV